MGPEKLNMDGMVLNLPTGTDKHEDYEYVIRYDKGIEVDFVLASGSVPVNYDYTRLQVEEHNNNKT